MSRKTHCFLWPEPRRLDDLPRWLTAIHKTLEQGPYGIQALLFRITKWPKQILSLPQQGTRAFDFCARQCLEQEKQAKWVHLPIPDELCMFNDSQLSWASHHSPGDSRECVAPAYSHSPRWMLCSLESLSSIPHNLTCGQKFLLDVPYSLG